VFVIDPEDGLPMWVAADIRPHGSDQDEPNELVIRREKLFDSGSCIFVGVLKLGPCELV
jgi:hypothetical protein